MDIKFIATMRTAILRKSSYVELLKTKNEMKPLKIYKIIVRNDKKKTPLSERITLFTQTKNGGDFHTPRKRQWITRPDSSEDNNFF